MENKRYTLAFDCDGVLRDFTSSFNKQFQLDFSKYKDFTTEITRWNWYYNYPWKEILIDLGIEEKSIDQNIIEEYSNTWLKFRSIEIFNNALPYSNVIENLKTIISLFEDELNFNIITHQSNNLAAIATINWLKSHNIHTMIPNIIIVNDAQDKKDNCDIIIDDSPKVIDSFKDEGKICIKVNYPYNQNSFSNFSISGLGDPSLFEKINDVIMVLDLIKLKEE